MIEDLVLHVGDCKTGSTSIQAALNQRLWTGAVPDVHFPRQGTHNDLAAPFFKRRVKAQKTKRMAALARDLRAATAPLAVVSAEHFEFADPAAVAEAFQRHLPQLQDRIRVIAYVRPHADRLVSSFAQHLKQRAVTETRMDDLLDRYVKTGRLHYAPRFSRWKTAFGDRFTLRPMVADTLYQGDVVADFFQYLFHGADVRLRPGTDANVGLSLQDLALIRALHARLDPSGSAKSTPKLKGLIPLLIRSLPRPVDPIKLRLHRSLAERVVDTYRADAAELDAMFFAGQPMTQALHAAPDKAVETPFSLDPADHLAPDTLRLVDGFASMMTRIIDANPKGLKKALQSVGSAPPTPTPNRPRRDKQAKRAKRRT